MKLLIRFLSFLFSGSMLQLEFYCALLGFLVLPMKKGTFVFCYTKQSTLCTTHPLTHHHTNSQKLLPRQAYYTKVSVSVPLQINQPTHSQIWLLYFSFPLVNLSMSPHSPLFFFCHTYKMDKFHV